MACFLLSMSIWAARDWSRSLIVKSAASTFVNGWKRPEDSSGATGTQQAASRGPPDRTRRLLLHATGVCPNTQSAVCFAFLCCALLRPITGGSDAPKLGGMQEPIYPGNCLQQQPTQPKNFWLYNLSTPEWGLPGSWLPPRERAPDFLLCRMRRRSARFLESEVKPDLGLS